MTYIIGLAGGSASGKSTFTHKLVEALAQPPALSAEVISTDGYFLPHERIRQFYSATRQKEMDDYNHPESIDLAHILADIETRCAAAQHPDVLIVEGLMVLHIPEIRALLDLKVFVELDADQRALRRLVRNLGHQYDPLDGEHSAETIANYFLESAKVGHERYVEPSRKYADLILRGDGDFTRTAPMLAAVVRDAN